MGVTFFMRGSMKMKYFRSICKLRIAAVIGAGLLAAMGVRAAESTTPPSTKPAGKPRPFMVYDNFSYLHPTDGVDTTTNGLVNCNLITARDVFGPDKSKHITDEATVKTAVRKAARKPGPLVYDLEYIYDFKLFLNLVKWAHEAAPGSVVGFYGHGLFPDPPKKDQKAEAAELAKAVDAFFPSMYTFDDNLDKWKGKMAQLVREAHKMAPGKPIYPYIWPKYHKGAAKSGQLTAEHWKFELDAARECRADGVVIWGASSTKENPVWWQETLKFIDTKPIVERGKTSDGKDVPDALDDKTKYGD